MKRKTSQSLNSVDFEKAKSKRPYSTSASISPSGMYANFLAQDLGEQVMPLNQRFSSKKEFKAYFCGEEADCNRLRQLLVDIPQAVDYEDCDFICDVINTIAKSISRYGFSRFEILHSVDKDKKLFKLHPMYIKNTYSLKIGTVQIYRDIIYKDFEETPGKYKISWWSNSQTLIINSPKTLYSKSKYQTILKLLNKFGDTPNTSLMFNSTGKFSNIGFDFKTAQKNIVLFRNKLTRKLGYHFRNSDSDYITEFYLAHKYVTFKLAKTILREHIIAHLNGLAKKLEINAEIIVKGLPTQTDLSTMLNQLQNSEISFSDSLKKSDF